MLQFFGVPHEFIGLEKFFFCPAHIEGFQAENDPTLPEFASHKFLAVRFVGIGHFGIIDPVEQLKGKKAVIADHVHYTRISNYDLSIAHPFGMVVDYDVF
jgi:hypothetical protein